MRKDLLCHLFILLSLCSMTTYGQQVTEKEAVAAALTYMGSEKGHYMTEDSVDNVFCIGDKGVIYLFEVCFVDGSSVVMSGHRACTPVVGLIEADEDKPTVGLINRRDSLPPAMRELLNHYVAQIRYCFVNSHPSYRHTEWDSLLNVEASPDNHQPFRDMVSPLLSTQWGQYKSNDGQPDAYNYHTPGCGIYNHCFTGCVSTAMAQIMRFWQEPKDMPSRCFQYNWNNMPNKLKSSSNHYFQERDAVAKLMRDCGNSVNMQYCGGLTVCENQQSGSSVENNVPDALKTFGYGDTYFASKDDYSENQWGVLIRSNLTNGRPLLYRGQPSQSTGPGHAFVCDGYRKKLFSDAYLYHFNWGWTGDGDGWFSVDNLNPEGSLSNFNYRQGAVVNIYPTTECWENIIMECDRSFSSGVVKMYPASGVFANNFHEYHICGGAVVMLFAGEEILLTDGFYAENNSFFNAGIFNCSSSLDLMTGNLENHTVASPTPKSLQAFPSSTNVAALTVYPNPADDLLFVELRGAEIARVALYDLQGRMVTGTGAHAGAPQQGTTATMNMRNVPAGVYLLRVTDADGKEYHRKIVKR